MTQYNKPISPLSQRMIDDMIMRKLSPKTQTGYIRHVRKFSEHLGRPPQTATREDLRLYQLHLVEEGIATGNLNAQIIGADPKHLGARVGVTAVLHAWGSALTHHPSFALHRTGWRIIARQKKMGSVSNYFRPP